MSDPRPIYEIDRNGVRLAWRPTLAEAQTLADELVLDAKKHFDKTPGQLRITHEHRVAGRAGVDRPVLWQDIIYAQELGKQWYEWDGRPNPLVVFTCQEVPYVATKYSECAGDNLVVMRDTGNNDYDNADDADYDDADDDDRDRDDWTRRRRHR